MEHPERKDDRQEKKRVESVIFAAVNWSLPDHGSFSRRPVVHQFSVGVEVAELECDQRVCEQQQLVGENDELTDPSDRCSERKPVLVTNYLRGTIK